MINNEEIQNTHIGKSCLYDEVTPLSFLEYIDESLHELQPYMNSWPQEVKLKMRILLCLLNEAEDYIHFNG